MSMPCGHVLFLLGGYGTRLTRDLQQSANAAHLRGLPKGLLPLGGAGKPLLDHWLALFQNQEQEQERLYTRDQVYYLTNKLYYPQFLKWLQ